MSNYIFYKDGTLQRPRGVSTSSYDALPYGSIITSSVEVSCSLRIYNVSSSYTSSTGNPESYVKSLHNILKYYEGYSPLFSVSNFTGSRYCFVEIPSLILGSGIQKGTVVLNYFITGNIAASASDLRQDGLLYSGNTPIGVVLYKEGFILINNTASISSIQDKYFNNNYDDARWTYWGIGTSSVTASSFDVDFKTISYTPSTTYLAHASKYDLNHSNNNTFISSSSYTVTTSSTSFIENSKSLIKNTVQSVFTSGSADFEKETYITKIGLYDKNKKLIAVASLAQPIRKTENREFTFKLKLDT